MTDTDLLDWLETQNQKAVYTGRCIFRPSTTGRGWRLHESADMLAAGTVRDAIRRAIVAVEAAGLSEPIKES